MKVRCFSEYQLKEASIRACETELEGYDRMIAEAEEPVFSDKFEEEINKIKNIEKCVTFSESR